MEQKVVLRPVYTIKCHHCGHVWPPDLKKTNGEPPKYCPKCHNKVGTFPDLSIRRRY